MNDELQIIIDLFSNLPSIGKKTATRIVLDLVYRKKHLLPNFIAAFEKIKHKIVTCQICHNLDNISPCQICISPKKNQKILCVVENIEDLWAIEQSGIFNGIYHILGGNLSAVKGTGPNELNIKSLEKRISEGSIEELVLALTASLDGQTTGYYLGQLFSDKVSIISKLGYGLPLGGEICYLDEGTLNAAFESRKSVM